MGARSEPMFSRIVIEAKASLASQELSKTQKPMCDRAAGEQGLEVYQGSMSPVVRIGRSRSSTSLRSGIVFTKPGGMGVRSKPMAVQDDPAHVERQEDAPPQRVLREDARLDGDPVGAEEPLDDPRFNVVAGLAPASARPMYTKALSTTVCRRFLRPSSSRVIWSMRLGSALPATVGASSAS